MSISGNLLADITYEMFYFEFLALPTEASRDGANDLAAYFWRPRVELTKKEMEWSCSQIHKNSVYKAQEEQETGYQIFFFLQGINF